MKEYLTDLVAYQCQICFKKVLCDVLVIKCHVIRRHKLKSLKEYIDMQNVRHVTKVTKLNVESMKFGNSALIKHEISESVGNLCKFSCLKCDYKWCSWKFMSKQFKLNQNEHWPVSSPIEYAAKIILHKCRLSDEHVLCDYGILQDHMRQHKLSLTAYMKQKQGSKSEGLFTQYHLELKVQIENIPAVQPCEKKRFIS